MTIRRDPFEMMDAFEMMDRMFEQMRRATMDDVTRYPLADPSRYSVADPSRHPLAERNRYPLVGPTRYPLVEDPDSDVRESRASFGFGSDANLRTERTDDGYRVMADLPGFEKEDITVRFEDGLLAITAESEATEEDEFTVSRQNRRVFDQLRLPGTIHDEEISATYRNGVLEVTVPVEGDVDDDEHVIDVR